MNSDTGNHGTTDTEQVIKGGTDKDVIYMNAEPHGEQ